MILCRYSMCESNGTLISAQTTLSNWKCVKSGAWLKCVSVLYRLALERKQEKKKAQKSCSIFVSSFFTVNTFVCAYTFFSGKLLTKTREKSGIQWIRRKRGIKCQ